MPKSKVRKKDSSSAQPVDRHTAVKAKPQKGSQGPSHPAYITVMLGMMIVGLLWLVVNYLAGEKIPFMADLGAWNFGIGFAFMIVGLLMTMRWR